MAQSRVHVAAGVTGERTKTGGRVLTAGDVANERLSTGGRVAVASGVAIERKITGGRALAAERVVWSPERRRGRLGEPSPSRPNETGRPQSRFDKQGKFRKLS